MPTNLIIRKNSGRGLKIEVDINDLIAQLEAEQKGSTGAAIDTLKDAVSVSPPSTGQAARTGGRTVTTPSNC